MATTVGILPGQSFPPSGPDLVAPEPEHCPGPSSQQAGKVDACAGCPNQPICSTAPQGPDPDLPAIHSRLSQIRHKLLILSGKGGVGKSTFTTLLSQSFSLTHPHDQIGLMDIDICGPSLPKMLGVEHEKIHTSAAGWSPVYIADNLSVMSIQFLLPRQHDAVIWRGPKKNGLIKQFLRDVEWGELDFLIIDTPPGTSDEHLSITALLKQSGIDGAILVTTPQEVALLDVRKEFDFCRKAGVKVLGIVENMSSFVCPNCETKTDIFTPTTGGGEALARSLGVEFLGKVPLDPRIGVACDYGESVFEAYPESQAVKALEEIVAKVRRIVVGDHEEGGEEEEK